MIVVCAVTLNDCIGDGYLRRIAWFYCVVVGF